MNREEILSEIWNVQDESFDLMVEYDALPHHYGDVILYQAEAYIVNCIGAYPNITTTGLAEALNKTASACSQVVRKLIDKGFVIQERNNSNKRVYNLTLTEQGQRLYLDHIEFNKNCQKITFDMLSDFTNTELEIYLSIQKRINEAYRGDIKRSREKYSKE